MIPQISFSLYSRKIFIPSIKTNNGKNSFDYYGPHFWNLLPSEIRNITNLNEFKITYLSHLKIWNSIYYIFINVIIILYFYIY